MTTTDLRSRVLALAGLLHSLKLVRQIADTGHAEAAAERIALDSVYRIDADSVDAVYGGVGALRGGLQLLREHLAERGADEALPRLGMAGAAIAACYRFIVCCCSYLPAALTGASDVLILLLFLQNAPFLCLWWHIPVPGCCPDYPVGLSEFDY